MLMPYATSVAAATLVFAQLFGRDAGFFNWVLSWIGIDAIDWRNGDLVGADRDRDHRHLAVDRLQRAHLPRRDAVDLAGPLRVPPRSTAPTSGSSSGTSPCRGCARRSCSPSWSRRSAPPSCSASRCCSATARPNGGALGQYQTLGLFMYQQGWEYFQLGRGSDHRLGDLRPGDRARPAQRRDRAVAHPRPQGDPMTAMPVRDVAAVHPPAPRPPRPRRRRGGDQAGPVAYTLLVGTAFLFLAPFYYMIVAASRPMSEMNQFPPPLTPGNGLWRNIASALGGPADSAWRSGTRSRSRASSR